MPRLSVFVVGINCGAGDRGTPSGLAIIGSGNNAPVITPTGGVCVPATPVGYASFEAVAENGCGVDCERAQSDGDYRDNNGPHGCPRQERKSPLRAHGYDASSKVGALLGLQNRSFHNGRVCGLILLPHIWHLRMPSVSEPVKIIIE